MSDSPGGQGRLRVAFFGGSFDPPHRGHIELARHTVEAAGLDRLFFVPAARNPHKPSGPRAPGELRVAMLEAAVAEDPRLGVIDWELHRPPPSYTVDTVRHLSERFPGAELHWLIGADQLPGLARWREIDELAASLTFLLLARPGSDCAQPEISGLRIRRVDAQEMAISSTEVRQRVAAGLPVDNLVPFPVLEILGRHPDLYAAAPSKS